MRRIWVSAAAAAASVSVAGWMAVSSADEARPGAALPPPSLFDDSPNQVRAVGAPVGVPGPAVVQAKPSASATVKAEASPPPPPENFEEERRSKAVWWKPWTWFSGNSSRTPRQVEPAATAATTPADTSSREGFALDSPSKRIRSGTGGCVKTGMWQGDGTTGHCGESVADAGALAAPAPTPTVASNASATSSSAGAQAQKPVPATPPVAPAVQPEPVVVSALAPEQDDHRKPLSEKDAFDSVRVNTGASSGSGELSPAAIAAARNSGQPAAEPAPGKGAGNSSSPEPMRMVDDKPLSMSAEALFGFKSSKLLYGGKKQLDEFARKLTDGDFQSVRVVGHTDRVGTAERNKRLSMRRAKAVKEYLVMKGIAPDRIHIDGRGAQEPVTEPRQCDGLPMTARRACMAPDRRVEIVVTRAFAKKKPDAAPVAGAPRS